MNLKKTDWVLISLLVIFIILNFIPKINRVSDTEIILASDPYAHLALEKQIMLQQTYPETYFWDVEEGIVGALPLYHVLNVLISLITGIDLYFFSKYFAIILSIIYIPLYFIFARSFTNNRTALIATLLFSSIHLLIGRTLLSLPENLAFVFFLTSLIFLNDKGKGGIMLSLFFGFAALLTHSFGYIYLTFIFLSLGYTRKEFLLKNKLKTFIILLIIIFVLIISINVNKTLFFAVNDLWLNINVNFNIGEFFKDFNIYWGVLPFMLSLFGVVYCMKEKNTIKIENTRLLNFLFVFQLILILALFFFSWHNTLRFYSYLAIPSMIYAAIFFDSLLKKRLYIVFIVLFITILVPFSYDYEWNYLYSQEDFIAIDFLNDMGVDGKTIITSSDMQRLLISQLNGVNYRVYAGNETNGLLEDKPEAVLNWIQNNNTEILIYFSANLNIVDIGKEPMIKKHALRKQTIEYLEKNKKIELIYKTPEVSIYKIKS